MIFTLLYIISIILVNWGFIHIPTIQILEDFWHPLSIVVGSIFVLRDYCQKEIGHKVLFVMILGILITYFMVSPVIAIASAVAFSVSELIDWIIFSLMKDYKFDKRVIVSSFISLPIDTVIFLYMINLFSISGIIIMSLSKIIGVLGSYYLLKKRRNNDNER